MIFIKHIITIFSICICLKTYALYQDPQMNSDETQLFKQINAMNLDDKQNLSLAINTLEKATLNDWAGEIVFFNLANLYMQNNDTQKAITAYEKSLQKNPDFFRAYKALGFVYLSENNAEKAHKPLTKALALSGTSDTDILIALAQNAIKNNDYSSALSLANHILIYSPKTKTAKDIKIQSLYKLKLYDQLKSLLLDLLENGEKQALYFRILANISFAQDDIISAISYMEILTQNFSPNNADLEFLADLYFNKALYTQAKALYSKVPTSPKINLKILNTLLNLEQYRQILDFCEKLDQNESDVFFARLQALKALNKNTDLIISLEKFTKDNPKNSRASFELAKLYSQNQNFAQAELLLKSLLGDKVYDEYVLYELLKIYLQTMRYPQAKIYIQQIDEKYPNKQIQSLKDKLNEIH